MRRRAMSAVVVLGFVVTLGCGACGADQSVSCESEACGECCLNSKCETEQTCDGFADSGTILRCDGPEDCSDGETCCAGVPASASFPIVAQCTAPAECSMIGVGVYYFCHGDADCGGLGACVPWEFGSYVSVCG